MKIGLLTIATGRYVRFLDELVESVRRHFLRGHEVHHYVFTDADYSAPDVIRIPTAHEPWPLVTLKRYHVFAAHGERLRAMDCLYYIDADMRFVRDCGDEILPLPRRRLVAVQHPAYYYGVRGWGSRMMNRLTRGAWGDRELPARRLPFERDASSLACIAKPAHRRYYAGGFNGGFADSFLTMSRSLRDAIDHDLAQGVIARWHDESHLNRYLQLQPPRRLPPAYCYPESGHPHLAAVAPVIVALDKDHAGLRAELSHTPPVILEGDGKELTSAAAG